MQIPDNVKEAIKEFLRMQIVSVLTATASAIFVIVAGINMQTGDIFVNWLVIRAGFLSFVLTSIATGIVKAVDKFIYKTQKDVADKEGKELGGWKGITGV